jgi:predicted RNA binding protein YcfA (HicA-like mRNA interferase family)/predicted RNase H-like HicB family nuclease
MLTNSRDIKRRLEQEGGELERIAGSHHVFKHPLTRDTIVLPHPKKDLGRGLVRAIYKQAKWQPDQRPVPMPHYVAIVEDAGSDKAIGLWFPDLPGCFSAGDTVDEALLNASEAVSLYAQSLAKEGRALPEPRSVEELRSDPEMSADLRDHVVALIRYERHPAHAAE